MTLQSPGELCSKTFMQNFVCKIIRGAENWKSIILHIKVLCLVDATSTLYKTSDANITNYAIFSINKIILWCPIIVTKYLSKCPRLKWSTNVYNGFIFNSVSFVILNKLWYIRRRRLVEERNIENSYCSKNPICASKFCFLFSENTVHRYLLILTA